MFLDEMGTAGETIPAWVKDAISRMFWDWFATVPDDTFRVRILFFTVNIRAKVKTFLERVFGPEPQRG